MVVTGVAELVERLALSGEPPDLPLALIHRSYSYENGRVPTNERLEFLGDTVLGLVVTEWLYHQHPDLAEGHLAKMRSAVVNTQSLADIASELDLGQYLLLGRGEDATGGREKPSILADALEAVLGAVYLDGGLEAARDLVLRLCRQSLAEVATLGAGLDWKTSLQELTARHSLGVPQYVVEGEGPDHARTFTARVQLGERLYGFGSGPTKKVAEQGAAQTAYTQLAADDGDA